jgi:hypothetical protein
VGEIRKKSEGVQKELNFYPQYNEKDSCREKWLNLDEGVENDRLPNLAFKFRPNR